MYIISVLMYVVVCALFIVNCFIVYAFYIMFRFPVICSFDMRITVAVTAFVTSTM